MEEWDSLEDLWQRGHDADGNEPLGDGYTYDGDRLPAYDPGEDPSNI